MAGQRRSSIPGRLARRLFGLTAAAGLTACAPVYPPITALDRGDSAFKARIAERHGPGTPAAPLRAELLAEGFEVVTDPVARRTSATFRAGNLPCYSAVRIDWAEDRRGRVTAIQAQRHDCS